MILLMMKAYSMLYLMISFALQSTENLRWFLATPIALMVLRNKSFTKVSLRFLFAITLREAFKNYLADFFRQGGGAPFPLRVFGQDDFPLRGEGGTPPFR